MSKQEIDEVKIPNHEQSIINPRPQTLNQVFCLPLRDILDPRSVIHENINMGNRMPAFTCGRHKVWGLTAYILHHFLMECFVPALLVNRPAQRLF